MKLFEDLKKPAITQFEDLLNEHKKVIIKKPDGIVYGMSYLNDELRVSATIKNTYLMCAMEITINKKFKDFEMMDTMRLILTENSYGKYYNFRLCSKEHTNNVLMALYDYIVKL